MTDKLDRLFAMPESPLSGKTAFIGFDAFVDRIVRPLREGDAHHASRPFDRMTDFGRFIERRAGRNASVELEERMEKLGGNAPILANALGCLGARIRAVGPFGSPALHPCFEPLSRFGEVHSIGEPGLCFALEFQDGKLMLALNRQINRLDYGTLAATLPPEQLAALLSGCDLLAFVNWSELPGSTDLLAGLARDVLPSIHRPTPLLVDLSDCSRRDPADVRDYLARLAALPAPIRTILSLNRNEADRVVEAFGFDPALPDAEKGSRLRSDLNLEWVVIHERTRSTIAWAGGSASRQTRMRRSPALQTGAGDNFNAGLCAGRLMDLAPADALALAALVSSFYVEHGRSAEWTELAAWHEREKKEIRT